MLYMFLQDSTPYQGDSGCIFLTWYDRIVRKGKIWEDVSRDGEPGGFEPWASELPFLHPFPAGHDG